MTRHALRGACSRRARQTRTNIQRPTPTTELTNIVPLRTLLLASQEYPPWPPLVLDSSMFRSPVGITASAVVSDKHFSSAKGPPIATSGSKIASKSLPKSSRSPSADSRSSTTICTSWPDSIPKPTPPGPMRKSCDAGRGSVRPRIVHAAHCPASTPGSRRMISAELAGIFERLGCTTDQWADRLTQLRRGRLLGRVFAAGRARLEEIAKKLEVRHLVNLRSCPA